MRVFGSLFYATTPKHLDKFSPRAIPAIHLGYSSSKKGYILYDLSPHSFFVSRDTVFKEGIFPFKDLQSSPSPVFPVLHFVDDSSSLPESVTTLDTSSDTSVSTSSLVDSHSLSEIVVSTENQPSLRTSTRLSKPPSWLDNYVTPTTKSVCLYPLSNYVSYSRLSPSYRASLAAYSTITEPKTYKEACLGPHWVKAMQT